jgi:putative ABC transport system permease protein
MESAVHRFFPDMKNYSDILNKPLMVNLGPEFSLFEIRAVMCDIPAQSHFHFDMIVSNENIPFSHADNWWNNGFRTYVLLRESKNIDGVLEKLPGIYRKNMGGEKFDSWVAEGNIWESFVQHLPDIHLKSNITGEWEPNSNIQYNRILTIVSIFIILIACVNFVNLSTSKAVIRSKEIGIKKALGSRRYQLIAQLLAESTVISFIAVILGIIIANLVLPAFNQFTGKHLTLMIFGGYAYPVLFLGFVLVLGLISGLYPAFYITLVQPVKALTGKRTTSRNEKIFRNGLVVFQFAISIMIISSTFLVNRQLEFVRNQNLGFNKENILVVNNAALLKGQLQTFKQELLKYPDVKSVSASFSVPGKGQSNMQFRPEGYEDNVLLDVIFADEDYVNTMGLQMIMGRYFDRSLPSDSLSLVINQEAMKNLGWNEPLDKTLKVWGNSGIPTKVIGVVNDYHYISMHEKIRPFVIIPSFHQRSFGTNYIAIKINGEGIPSTVKKIEESWKGFSEFPFDYFFMDESYDQLYKNEAYTKSIFSIFAVISIFIALLGLFGMAVYITSQRTKEIGIRKTFGASAQQIMMLLSGQFSKSIIIGFIIAVPVSWWLMQLWLQNFAYQTGISVWIYIISFLLVILTAWLTTGYQSLKAALKNPVDALRYE